MLGGEAGGLSVRPPGGQCCYLGELLDRVMGKRARSKKGVKFLGVSGGTVRGDSGLIVNGKIVAV